jgi:drug/metabolite transporter (DMT)-like permease
VVSNRTRALLLQLLAILCWSVSPIFMRTIKDHFSVYFQILVRNVSSLMLLWPAVLMFLGRRRTAEVLRLLPPLLPKLGLIALLSYLFQVAFTTSLYLIYPGVVTLIYQSGVLFSVLFGFLLFADERRTIKSRLFQIGLVMAISGVAAVIASGGELGKAEFNIGVLIVILSAAFWAMLGTLIRRWLSAIPGIVSVTVVFTILAPLYLITHIGFSGGFVVPRAPAAMWIMMVTSGLIGMGVGQTAYYYAIGSLGIALAGSLGLLTPLITGLLSYVVFGEVLSLWQMLGGVALVAGSFLVIRSRFKAIREES